MCGNQRVTESKRTMWYMVCVPTLKSRYIWGHFSRSITGGLLLCAIWRQFLRMEGRIICIARVNACIYWVNNFFIYRKHFSAWYIFELNLLITRRMYTSLTNFIYSLSEILSCFGCYCFIPLVFYLKRHEV